jgi:hypothetical protein
MHRDLPEMVARSYADVAFTWYHLVSFWARVFPDHFEFIAVPGVESFFTKIAFARTVNPLRSEAAKAFDEFFFARARDPGMTLRAWTTASLARRWGSTEAAGATWSLPPARRPTNRWNRACPAQIWP